MPSGERDPATYLEWQALDKLRRQSNDQEYQNEVGAGEHAAFAKSYVKENPLTGVPTMAAAIPAYTLAKALGLMSGRSEPSLNEMGAGAAGALSGLGENVGDALNWFTDSPSPVAKPSRSPNFSSQLSPEEIRAMVLRRMGGPPAE